MLKKIGGKANNAAYAKALGLKGVAKKLKDATKEIYGSDKYVSKLAGSVEAAAA